MVNCIIALLCCPQPLSSHSDNVIIIHFIPSFCIKCLWLSVLECPYPITIRCTLTSTMHNIPGVFTLLKCKGAPPNLLKTSGDAINLQRDGQGIWMAHLTIPAHAWSCLIRHSVTPWGVTYWILVPEWSVGSWVREVGRNPTWSTSI